MNVITICLLTLATVGDPAGATPEAGPQAGPEPAQLRYIESVDQGASARLGSFFAALQGLETKARTSPVRIGWWGDSAIVGDGFTGQVRRRLQARFGDAGPGFMLAATTFNGYLRKGVRLKRHGWETANVIQGGVKSGRYGYGGIVASSWGGASSTFETREAPFDTALIYYRSAPKGGALQLFVDGAKKATARQDANEAHGADHVWAYELGAAGAKKVRVRAVGGGKTRLYGVALERKGPGVVLDSLGLLGMRARRWLRADAEHMAAQIQARGPKLLVLAFGGNERVDPGLSEDGHADEITRVTALFRAGAPEASCLIMGPVAHGKARKSGRMGLDPALKTIYAAQRRAAEAAGCAFFDTIAAMGGGDTAVRSFKKRHLMGKDLAHLTPKGHVAVGDLIADWLMVQYEASLKP